MTARARQCASSRAPPLRDRWFPIARASDAETRARPVLDAVADAQGPPFDSGTSTPAPARQAERRRRARLQQTARANATTRKLAIAGSRSSSSPTLVTRGDDDEAPSTPSTPTHPGNRWTAWAGSGIFRVSPDGAEPGQHRRDLNRGGAQNDGAEIPCRIADGDRAHFVIGGVPVPYCLARIPQGGEIRGNLAAGGKGVAQPLTPRDHREIAQALGPVLAARPAPRRPGRDRRRHRINVTSPTASFRGIMQQTGCDVARLFVDALEVATRTP